MKEITPDQAKQWDIGNFFVPNWLPNMIFMNVDGLFDGIFNKTFQEILLTPLHAVARDNRKAIINEGLDRHLNKVQKKKSA